MSKKPKPLSLAEYARAASRPVSTRCTTCRSPELSQHVLDYLALRDSPDHQTWQTWPWFCEFLRNEHGIALDSITTVYNHVRNCLRRRT